MMRLSGVNRIVTAGLLLGLGACGGDSGDRPAPLPLGAPTGLSESPILIVGERPGDPNHEFFRVVTPLLLENGGVAVPIASDGTIRIFDSGGAFVRSFGSAGEGPGEFGTLWSAWVRGDTIEAHDVDLGRVTRFVTGEPAQTVLLEGVDAAEIAAPGLADGTWILHGVKKVQPSGRDVIGVNRFGADGSHMEELHETYGFRRHAFPGGGGPDPVSPRAIIRTAGQRVFIAETLTPRITELNVATGDVRTIEWAPPNHISPGEAVRMVREEIESAAVPERERAWTQSSLNALTGSEEVPAFWDFLVDGDEFFWIRPYDPRVHGVPFGGLQGAGGGGEWIVLDRHGNSVTTITVPEDFEPRRVEGDRLIGVRRDEFDVESVRVFRIERTGA